MVSLKIMHDNNEPTLALTRIDPTRDAKSIMTAVDRSANAKAAAGNQAGAGRRAPGQSRHARYRRRQGRAVYLKEFLSDPRVIEDQGLLWKLALNGVILRTRPRRKARDYRKIWNVEKKRIAAQDHHPRASREARRRDFGS